jgi:hypothetical protein
MSGPYRVVLTSAEDRALAARLTSGRTEYRDRIRAQIVLEAAHGASNTAIAENLSLCVDTVRTWRRRFATVTGDRLAALTDCTQAGGKAVGWARTTT